MMRLTLEKLGFSVYDKKLFLTLLLPSGLSALGCMLFSLAVVVIVFVSSRYSNSILERQVTAWRMINSESDLSYYGGSHGVTLDSVLGTVVTFIMWASFGLIIYWFVEGAVKAIRTMSELKHELHYVHANAKGQLTVSLIRLGVRGLVVLGWYFYLQLFFHTILFYCLSWLYVAALNLTTIVGVAYLVLAFVALALAMHVNVVIVRLLVLRPRLFGETSQL